MQQRGTHLGSLRGLDIDGIKRLPQEIWDSIIQELSGDRRALKACILTCRAWRETSRRLLWRSITTPLKLHDNLISIHSLLAEHPDIAQLVSSVLLHLDFEELLSLTPFTTLTELAVHGAVRILYLTPSALYVSGGFQMLSVTKPVRHKKRPLQVHCSALVDLLLHLPPAACSERPHLRQFDLKHPCSVVAVPLRRRPLLHLLHPLHPWRRMMPSIQSTRKLKTCPHCRSRRLS